MLKLKNDFQDLKSKKRRMLREFFTEERRGSFKNSKRVKTLPVDIAEEDVINTMSGLEAHKKSLKKLSLKWFS